MGSLLQSQIQENCKLSLPEGLKDLMSDISREVLRFQPQNVYDFIAKYLESLLEVREALSVAHEVCDDTPVSCEAELEDELRAIGFDEDDLENAVKVIKAHFNSGSVKEPNLFIKLIKKTGIEEYQIPAIQEAVRRTFKRQRIKNNESKYLHKNLDESTKAVKYTMKFYEENKHQTEDSFALTTLKSHVKNNSSTSTGEYHQSSDIKTEINYDFNKSSEILQEEQSLTVTNATDKELGYKKYADDTNSEIDDEFIIESDVSNGDDDEIDQTNENLNSLKCEEVIEEIIVNEELENNSILSSVDESLPSDESDKELY